MAQNNTPDRRAPASGPRSNLLRDNNPVIIGPMKIPNGLLNRGRLSEQLTQLRRTVTQH
jgi:hypothetical protein